MVLVSVVLPSYNYDKYISEAIESVLNQTFSDLELIIIDDYSTDTSREIIKGYKEKDDRIRFIFHEKNEGMARTYNDGIFSAKGKYIAILDSDDLWDLKKLEKQVKILEKDENLIVWSDGDLIDAKGNFLGKTFTQRYHATKKKKVEIFS